jgi:hypothetical protein
MAKQQRYPESITFRVSHKMFLELQDVADKEDCDLSELVRDFVERSLRWQRQKYKDEGGLKREV